jgi:GDP-4-dehydro-6-deoxy-D-mannose reductase
MKNLLITGISGFVGSYLADYCALHEQNVSIHGFDISVPPDGGCRASYHYHKADLLDKSHIEALIQEINPVTIIHLASFSSVGDSWRDPIKSFKNNTTIFLNLLEIIHSLKMSCRILSVGSSEEYGIVKNDSLPLTESAPLNPVSPYAVARVAQEQLSHIYAKGFGMDIVCTRSFNHIGPGQADKFVVSSIGRQFAEIKKGQREKLHIGNTSIIRDFLDVRDVVRAYCLLIEKGRSGETYNICSGKGISITELIDLYGEIAGFVPQVEIKPELLRPVENPVVTGSYGKLADHVGWKPEITLVHSLRDIYTYWTRHI